MNTSKIKVFFIKSWKIGRWILLTLLLLFIALVIYRIPFVVEQGKTQKTISYIKAQKITMDDVTGKNLPSVPDKKLNDSTVEGIDANNNGIRDDVELAIFKKYPNNIKIRAALLQYAMTQQLYLTKVFNSETWVGAVKHEGGGIGCIVDTSFKIYSGTKNKITKSGEWMDFVDGLMLNSDKRVKMNKNINKFEVIYADGGKETCDINLNSL